MIFPVTFCCDFLYVTSTNDGKTAFQRVSPEYKIDYIMLHANKIVHSLINLFAINGMSLVMRKLDFCICENKDADQLRGNREADQHLCFRYMDSTITLLSKSEISKL